MLAGAPFIAFVGVTDLAEATRFYVGVLGLPVREEGPYAVVVDAGSTMLRLTPVGGLRPQPFTVAGWAVADLDAAVGELARRGVVLSRFDGLDQDERGIWEAPGGDRVAWFADPDGNVLSVTAFAPR